MHEARYYESLEQDAVNKANTLRCLLCPHECVIPDDKKGICTVRENRGGRLYATSYGRITSVALDPIEKKPLYHFHKGSHILSIGSYGCNFHCGFCQNHDISMGSPRYDNIEPRELAAMSKRLSTRGNIGVAYTYNEPFISAEYMNDCMNLIHEQGQKNVVVTNGYVSEPVLRDLLPLIDAMNIDLKSFNDAFYQKIGGHASPVKKNIELAANHCHVEVTTLIIPGENDSEEEMDELSGWLASIDKKIPLHVSRFFPRHKYEDREATDVGTVYRLADVARRHLDHVYTGNC